MTTPAAPPLSIVITVCDSVAAEACPVFFGGVDQLPIEAMDSIDLQRALGDIARS